MKKHLISIILLCFYLNVSAQDLTIGKFPIFREITKSMVTNYFGSTPHIGNFISEDQRGEDIPVNSYRYKDAENNRLFVIDIFTEINRISSFEITRPDYKYAINGILVVGDPISNISKLGYEIDDENYAGNKTIVVFLPPYKIGDYDYLYNLEVRYDNNNIITSIVMREDVGV